MPCYEEGKEESKKKQHLQALMTMVTRRGNTAAAAAAAAIATAVTVTATVVTLTRVAIMVMEVGGVEEA
jgi:hypothetical protein